MRELPLPPFQMPRICRHPAQVVPLDALEATSCSAIPRPFPSPWHPLITLPRLDELRHPSVDMLGLIASVRARRRGLERRLRRAERSELWGGEGSRRRFAREPRDCGARPSDHAGSSVTCLHARIGQQEQASELTRG